ncbi:hypothetical protein OAA_19700 [Vibrio cyclitrophicus 1F175]|uniref:hypothetical protein n=1 Tax=Vibrio cyclitrophicus TaxID=47951 RepID=UPI0002F0E98F|nr:hypothetical protein [Vibrio cyclitrophicus]OEF67387.1 hypothetical protein OAA_19700 [Vibrio cyclitrophicus 1F175]
MKIKHRLGVDNLLLSKIKFKAMITVKVTILIALGMITLKTIFIPNIPLIGTLTNQEIASILLLVSVLTFAIIKIPYHFLFTLNDNESSVELPLMVTEIHKDKISFHLINPFDIGSNKATLCNELRSTCHSLNNLYGYCDFTISTPSFIGIDGNKRKAICKLAERTIKFKKGVDVTNRIIAKPWYNLGRFTLILKSMLRTRTVNTRYFYEINAKL